jgi:hypothetical protein
MIGLMKKRDLAALPTRPAAVPAALPWLLRVPILEFGATGRDRQSKEEG